MRVSNVNSISKLKDRTMVEKLSKPKLKNKHVSSGPKLAEWTEKPFKTSSSNLEESRKKEISQEIGSLSEQKGLSELKTAVNQKVPEIEVKTEDLKEKYPKKDIFPTIQEEMEEVLGTDYFSKNEGKNDTITPNKEKYLEKTRVPYREQRIKNLPNAKQLLQRQHSAQEILRVIREGGMIEIPMNRPELHEVFRAVDLLACKPMRGENGRCIILLIPIKHVITTDPVYVWDSHVMTGNIDGDPTTAQNMAINTHTRKLLQASEFLFSDMIDGRSLITLITRYIGISMKVNLTFKNRRLYLGLGEIEYQVIIDPVLLCDTEVHCLEKTLPYAYQQGSNLHVISHCQLNEFLNFLELKYRLLNRHDISQNAVMKVKDTESSTFKQMQRFSLPFLAYGVLFSFFLILGLQEAVRFCISLGFGLIFVYGGSIGYFLYHHFQSLKHVGSEFSVPYHQKPIELSEEDFILINEQLSPEWMAQFVHEVENHQNCSYKKGEKYYKYQANSPPILSPPFEEEELMQTIPDDHKSSINDQVKSKYQAFLDD